MKNLDPQLITLLATGLAWLVGRAWRALRGDRKATLERIGRAVGGELYTLYRLQRDVAGWDVGDLLDKVRVYAEHHGVELSDREVGFVTGVAKETWGQLELERQLARLGTGASAAGAAVKADLARLNRPGTGQSPTPPSLVLGDVGP